MTTGRCASTGWWLRGFAAALAVVLSSCVQKNPDDFMASARAYQALGDNRAAVIQVRNAVQQRPEDGDFRLYLGRLLLEGRDPVAADRELRKALAYGQSVDVVLPSLARAMLERGAERALIEEFGEKVLAAPAAEATFKSTLGRAYLHVGRTDDAAASFNAAASVQPGYLPARIGIARVLAIGPEPGQALELAERLVAEHPVSGEALLLLAEVLALRGDRATSKEALQQAVRVDGNYLPARYTLLTMLIDDQQLDAAASQLKETRQHAGDDLRVQYFDAVIALHENDLVRAREASRSVLSRAPEHVPTLVLTGALELQALKPVAAETALRKAISLDPQHVGARGLLVRTLLVASRPVEALDAVQPLLVAATGKDPSAAALAGETYMANGRLAEAAHYYAAAAESKAEAPLARTRLGQIAILAGDGEGGITLLEAVAAGEDAPVQAHQALIAGYLQSGRFDRALAAARRLAGTQPDNALPYELLGSVYLAKQDFAAARNQYEQALSMSPDYLPALHALATLDIAAGNGAAARQRFEAAVARQPKSEPALIGVADVMSKTGAPSGEVAATLLQAIRANPQSPAARLALVGHYRNDNAAGPALSAAQEAASALPSDPRVLFALAWAQDAAGQMNQAADTYQRLVALEPRSAVPLLQLAGMYARYAEHALAVGALQRAQSISSDEPADFHATVSSYVSAGAATRGISDARAMQISAPKFLAGYVLEGELHAAAARWADAERAYLAGLGVLPDSGSLALRVREAMVAVGKAAEADSFARRWLANHPRNVEVRVKLADQALRARNFKSAQALYRGVVEHEPENFVALNNLAWASGQIGDPKALEYAQRAAEIAPTNADVLETLGSLLLTNGQPARGVEYLGKASSLAPKRSEIRLNYAKALVKVGKRELARVELEALQADGDGASHTEVAAVLKNL